MSERANIAYVESNGSIRRKNVNQSFVDCHMLHQDGNLVAALSNCIDGHMMGFISTEADTFEITPLTQRLKVHDTLGSIKMQMFEKTPHMERN